MENLKLFSSILSGVILMSSSVVVMATDITRDVRGNSNGVHMENGGYFSLGVGAYAFKDNWQKKDEADNETNSYSGTLVLSGAYRYGGLFLEAEHESLDGLNLGYTFWNNSHWTTDVLFSIPGGNLTVGEDEYVVAGPEESEKERSDNLIYRLESDTWLTGAGFRVTGYLSDYVVQYRLLTDAHKGNGVFSSLRFGKSWQVKNWNFYGLASAEYYSEDIANYFYGVSSEEATERFSEYHADAGVRASIKFGVTYPLGEHWVGEASILAGSLTSAEKESPLVNGNNYRAQAGVSISYVF